MSQVDTVKSEVKDGLKGFTIASNMVLIECEQDVDTYGQLKVIQKVDKYKRFSRSGWVRQIGEDVKDCGLNLNDKVFFESYAGNDVDFGDKPYKIITPEMVLCVIDS